MVVATRLEVALHPIPDYVMGGWLISDAAPALRAMRDETPAILGDLAVGPEEVVQLV